MSDEERVEEGLRRENYGLTSQRVQAIKDRYPDRGFRLLFEREDGVVVRARPGYLEGARV